jgi:hypothetical protein
MSEFGTCEQGCHEQKLELVAARHYDRLVDLAAEVRSADESFQAIVDELATRRPRGGDCEVAYRSIQRAARAALRSHPDLDAREPGWEEPERATIWWCADCGGVDAPQECLGICIWRRVEWVNAARHEQQLARARAERGSERDLRQLVRLVASVTPRGGHWERGWAALAARAQQLHRAAPAR